MDPIAGQSKRQMHERSMLLISGLRMMNSEYECKWYQFVRNDEVRRLTGQPKLTAIVQSHRLTLFGHIARMDDNTDAKRILYTLSPED